MPGWGHKVGRIEAERCANLNITITVIYDNNPYKAGLKTGWGLSCLVKGTEKTILFDTGGDGSLLLGNMKALRIDPKEIGLIFLSHIHNDHVGGLWKVIEKNPNVTVYIPISFPDGFKKEARSYGIKLIEVQQPTKICEGVYSTGELGSDIKEQSLIVKDGGGLILITGCAHPGIVKIINKAKDLIKDDLLLVIGGYHLGGKSKYEIESIILNFKKLGVRYVCPCHCTGDKARQLFEKEYQRNYIDAGVGKVIDISKI